jgi:hypothetical protein
LARRPLYTAGPAGQLALARRSVASGADLDPIDGLYTAGNTTASPAEVAEVDHRRAIASPPHRVARSSSLNRFGSSSIMFQVAPSRPNPTQKAAIVPSSTICSSLK